MKVLKVIMTPTAHIQGQPKKKENPKKFTAQNTPQHPKHTTTGKLLKVIYDEAQSK